MRVHHVFDGVRIEVEVEVFRDFLLLLQIVEGHARVDGLDVQFQSVGGGEKISRHQID